MTSPGQDLKNLRDLKTSKYPSNEQRTAEWTEKFDRGRILRSLITAPAPTIFDVGAYTGKSIIDFKGIFPDARIISFEPNPNAIDALRNVARSYSSVEIIECAVTNFSGKVKFYQQGINPGLSGLIPRNIESRDSIDLMRLREGLGGGDKYHKEVNKAELEVKAVTLEEFSNSRQLTNVDFIKIDV